MCVCMEVNHSRQLTVNTLGPQPERGAISIMQLDSPDLKRGDV